MSINNLNSQIINQCYVFNCHCFINCPSNFVEDGCSDENGSLSSISLKPDDERIQQSAVKDCAKIKASKESMPSEKLENDTENLINNVNVSTEDDNDDEFENIFQQLKKQDRVRYSLNILFILVAQLLLDICTSVIP